ncbi:Ig-like domain-containing protein, partial [Fructilactobacillus florum]|uniref:Ig-like domain-containing protein n=1 Tax=Fructilactobacillus florum TaxID=640331 RepID=UPI0005554FC6
MLKKPFTPKIIYPTGKLLLTTTMISIGIGLVNNTTVSADTKSPNYVKTASDPQTTDKSEIQALSRHFDFDSMFSVTSQFSRYLGKNDPMNPDSYRTTQLFGGSADVSLKYQINKDEGTVTVTDCQIKWTPNIALSNRANPATKESYFGLYFQVPYPKKYSDIDFSAGLSDRESYISRNKFFNMTKNPDLQAISVMYRDVSQNYNNYQYMENHDWVPYTVPITDGKADLLRPAMRTNSFSDSGSNSGDVYYTQANDMKDIIITLAKQITVDPAKQGDEKITGKGDEGAQLTVTDGAGNEIGTGSINNDGTYSVSTKRPLKGGEVITVQAKNPDGSTDAAHVTVSGEAPKAADVTVNYVDTDGHPLTKAETLTGNYDDPYTTTKKDIKG